jgi:hypothetical protein
MKISRMTYPPVCINERRRVSIAAEGKVRLLAAENTLDNAGADTNSPADLEHAHAALTETNPGSEEPWFFLSGCRTQLA